MSAFYNTSSDRQQSGRHGSQGRFSLEGAILIVDTEEDAHAAREHLGMEAFVFDRLAEQLPPGGLTGSAVVVSAHDAYERANALIDAGAPRLGVMFVDLAPLQGQTLAGMAEQGEQSELPEFPAAESIRPHPALPSAPAPGLGGARAAGADPLRR